MHILDKFSLSTGLKVDKSFIYEKFFPLPVDKYITLQPFSSKVPAKCYDLWIQVLAIILPVLDKNGIRIIQLGGRDEFALPGTINLAGQTNWGNFAAILRNSILHLGVDSCGIHIANYYGKKIVGLYSNNFTKNVGPYNPKSECILLEPDRQGKKPSFSLVEQPKTINFVKPEDIARAVCKLLNLELDYPYNQFFLGEMFIAPMIESAMFTPINIDGLGIRQLIARMDFNFNEVTLDQQLAGCPCSIITNKPINLDILKKYRVERVKEVIYVVEENNSDFDFYKGVTRLGIPLRFLSDLPEEKINELKIKYFEIGIIQRKTSYDWGDITKDKKNVYYISSKFTIGKDGKIYPSRAAMELDLSIPSHIFMQPTPVIDSGLFRSELLNFRLLEKNV